MRRTLFSSFLAALCLIAPSSQPVEIGKPRSLVVANARSQGQIRAQTRSQVDEDHLQVIVRLLLHARDLRASRSRSTQPAIRPISTEAVGNQLTNMMWLSVTAYTSTGNRMANGQWPYVGAAAGNRWPLGTRLRVPGVGVVTVTDRIGCCSSLDLFMSSGAQCARWGRRRLLVEVLP